MVTHPASLVTRSKDHRSGGCKPGPTLPGSQVENPLSGACMAFSCCLLSLLNLTVLTAELDAYLRSLFLVPSYSKCSYLGHSVATITGAACSKLHSLPSLGLFLGVCQKFPAAKGSAFYLTVPFFCREFLWSVVLLLPYSLGLTPLLTTAMVSCQGPG